MTYAKDTDKKIRASKNAKFLNGEQLVSHPPGYKKDPNIKIHYVIDEETTPVVRKIFEMYANGVGRNTIVNHLRDNKILMPAAVLHVRGIRYSKQMEIEENRYRWISKVELDEDKIMKRLRKLKNQGTSADDNTSKKVAKKEKRLSENTRIYAKLYEDRALEIVSEENFKMLSDRLQDEQKKGA